MDPCHPSEIILLYKWIYIKKELFITNSRNVQVSDVNCAAERAQSITVTAQYLYQYSCNKNSDKSGN